MPTPLLSVIVSTYNRPDALRAVLEGLLHQSETNFECIVADDGSTTPTREVVDAFAQRFHGRLKHVWHADEGFRLSAIRNLAAEHSSGEFLCFLDGDCVPRNHFVAAHQKIAEEGWISRGSRVLMSEAFTQQVLHDLIPMHALTMQQLSLHHRAGDLNRVHPMQEGPLDFLRNLTARFRPAHWRSVRTCNVVVSKHNLITVRGFDENFTGWGFEDSDFCVRMLNAGIRIQRAPAATTVLHLWHQERDRSLQSDNMQRLQQTLRDRRILPVRGLYGDGLQGIVHGNNGPTHTECPSHTHNIPHHDF